jgi:hypothetical protein
MPAAATRQRTRKVVEFLASIYGGGIGHNADFAAAERRISGFDRRLTGGTWEVDESDCGRFGGGPDEIKSF